MTIVKEKHQKLLKSSTKNVKLFGYVCLGLLYFLYGFFGGYSSGVSVPLSQKRGLLFRPNVPEAAV